MSSNLPIINLTPIPVKDPIAVITPVELIAPFDITADYSAGSKTMKVCATISVPNEVLTSSIILYQYIDPSNPLQLQFYFVYDLTGTGNGNTLYSCPFNASNVDCDGHPIKLSKVTTVYTMLKDADPKTSRGTVASVRSIGGTLDEEVPKK